MANDEMSVKPVRILNFLGQGEHDLKVVNTNATTYNVKQASDSERISYTVSYSGDALTAGIKADEFEKDFTPFITQIVQENLPKFGAKK